MPRRGKPNLSDVGLYAFDYLYGNLRRKFSRTRKEARMVFFNMVGYLFVDWTEYSQCPVHDSDVTLCWAAPFGPAVAKNSQIPLCTSYEELQVERAL